MAQASLVEVLRKGVVMNTGTKYIFRKQTPHCRSPGHGASVRLRFLRKILNSAWPQATSNSGRTKQYLWLWRVAVAPILREEIEIRNTATRKTKHRVRTAPRVQGGLICSFTRAISASGSTLEQEAKMAIFPLFGGGKDTSSNKTVSQMRVGPIFLCLISLQ